MVRVEVPDDPLDWRPQEPLVTRTPVTIRDPIVEPLWSGTRVLAHVDTRAVQPQPGVQLMASMGIDIGFDEPELVTAIGDAVLAAGRGARRHRHRRGDPGCRRQRPSWPRRACR